MNRWKYVYDGIAYQIIPEDAPTNLMHKLDEPICRHEDVLLVLSSKNAAESVVKAHNNCFTRTEVKSSEAKEAILKVLGKSRKGGLGSANFIEVADEIHQTLMDMVNNDKCLYHPLDDLAARVHKANAKWWVDLHTQQPIKRNYGELCMLMTSEIAESMEADRKDLMDDKLTNYKGRGVEIVDLLIRVLNIAGSQQYGFPIGEIFEAKMLYNANRVDHTDEHRKGQHGKAY